MAVALLFKQPGRRLAGALLSSLLFVTALNVLPWFFVASGRAGLAPPMMYVSVLFGFGVAPLYYFHTRALTDPSYTPKLTVVLLAALLPGGLRVLIWSLAGFDADAVAEQLRLMGGGQAVPVGFRDLVVPTVGGTYALAFFYLTWRHMRQTAARLRAHFSDEIDQQLVWIKVLTLGMVLLLGSVFAVMAIGMSSGVYRIETEYSLSALRCLVIQAVAVFAFLRPEALTRSVADLKVPRHRSPLDRTKAEGLAAVLCSYMETEKPYRRAGLKLADLAESLDMPGHVLSQVINEEIGMSFFDFINKFRVEEAKDLLQKPDSDHYTLVAIANEAGFSSKTAFNRAFKKHARMTPSSYREQIAGASPSTP